MHSLIEKLHDIEGVDVIGMWPLAIGWWVLLVLGLLFLCMSTWLFVYILMFKRSWKSDTLQKLKILEKELSEATARETISVLSEYLRRIVLKRFSRKECAGLVGQEWLKWLSQNDLKQFDWETEGKILIEVPYAPLNGDLSMSQVKGLIHAVRNWVL